MNVNVKNGLVTVTSDTRGEALELFEWYMGRDAVVVNTPSRKRPLHLKTCDICKKECKGASGLGIHKRTIHGIKGKNSEYNKRYHLKKELERAGLLHTN